MGHWAVTADRTERRHVIVDLTYLVPGMELVTKFCVKENEKLGSTKSLMFLNETRNCQFRIKELVKILFVHFLKNTRVRSKNEISFPTLRLRSSWPNIPNINSMEIDIDGVHKNCWDHFILPHHFDKTILYTKPKVTVFCFLKKKNDLYRIQIIGVNMADKFYLLYIYIYIYIYIDIGNI